MKFGEILRKEFFEILDKKSDLRIKVLIILLSRYNYLLAVIITVENRNTQKKYISQ